MNPCPDRTRLSAALALLLALSLAPAARAQTALCSSDGQPRPQALHERFISADCATCWSDPQTPRATPGAVALDWVLPGAQGDEAPLSAVARREGLERLANGTLPAGGAEARRMTVTRSPGAQLRVAHGQPLGGYVGASIRWQGRPGGPRPARAWLALVEQLPAGTEGSPVARNLVRNVLEPAWNGDFLLSKQKFVTRTEWRPMNIPAGADPERLQVVGWVEDAQGRVLAVAQSACAGGR